MKLPSLLVAGAAGLLLASCASRSARSVPYARGDMWVGAAIQEASLNRAIVAQRTLYPYHFVAGAEQLNSLGLRDLEVLARHVEAHGGEIRLHKGAADLRLYAARQRAVKAALLAEGFELDGVLIVDRPAGGRGIPGARAAEQLEPEPLSEPLTISE